MGIQVKYNADAPAHPEDDELQSSGRAMTTEELAREQIPRATVGHDILWERAQAVVLPLSIG
jgi:hypothetical protein